jgi:DNA processing protein
MRERADLPESVVEALATATEQVEGIEEELASLDERGVRALIWEDEDYPRRLLGTSSAPPVLWWAGPAEPNEWERAVAVVGSREATAEGIAEARRVGADLGRAGAAVVSGLAAGVDEAGHEGALEAGGGTVGVCGCGLMAALVQGRGGLAGRVGEAGALCSELAPTAPLTPQALFARDRIIAGLADVVIVVEARAEGGAVHTAKCALKEGRPVLVTEWPAGHGAGGNRQLLGEGARGLELGGDVVGAVRGVVRG